MKSGLTDLTCLIPLYKSKRFLDIIIRNIDDHLASGARILISDKHQFDETASILEKRYKHEPNVKVFASKDNGDWVDNINFLIRQANGKYIRIIPHDDTAFAESSKILVKSLEQHKTAIVSSGFVVPHDLNNQIIPGKGKLSNLNELGRGDTWGIHDSLELNWKQRFQGAFKGVIRLNLVKERKLFIRKTPTLNRSDRAWLFALSLVGRFCFEPKPILIKRFYNISTSANWNTSPKIILGMADTMYKYCEELIDNVELLNEIKFNIYHNAIIKSRHLETKIGPKPEYCDIHPKLLFAPQK